MSLNKNILLKIAKILNHTKKEILDVVPSKKDIERLTKNQILIMDMIIEVRKELDTEHEARYKKLETVAKQTDKNTKYIKIIKQHINLTGKY